MKSKLLIGIMLTLVVGYGLFEARRIIAGPEVTIVSPADGAAVAGPTLTVRGTAKNVSFFTINDSPAFTDPSGNFSYTLSPAPGYTVVTVASIDRFGRRAAKSIALTVLDYCPV